MHIRLIIRGTCALRPGLRGVSESIEVVSILGRFLEHPRIMQFGPDDLLIGSADLMPRNLDRRVEVLTPVEDPELRRQLRQMLDITLADNFSAWRLSPGGSWSRLRPGPNEERRNSQEQMMALAQDRALETPVG